MKIEFFSVHSWCYTANWRALADDPIPLCIVILRKIVLLQQSRDLICTPQVMVDSPIFGLTNRGKLDYERLLVYLLQVIQG